MTILMPQVQAVVERLGRSETALTDMSVGEARRVYVQTLSGYGGTAVAMAAVREATVPLPGRAVGIRLYRPTGLSESPAPTVVYYHGGGWVLGDLDSHDKICRQLADRSRCQVIAVDYRLAPEHPMPASSEDAIDAFAWLRSHAADYDLDPQRLVVAGDSAGGHLAAVVALAARDQGWPLALQVLVYPVTDLRPAARDYPSRLRNADVLPLTSGLMDWFAGHAVDARTQTGDWRVSPVLAASLQGVAPAWVMTMGADVLMDEGVLYAARLRDAGVTCEHVHFPGVIHGALEMYDWLPLTAHLHETIASAVRKTLT